MTIPTNPKIYHIVHVDNLASIVADGFLWSDSIMAQRAGARVIGNREIKNDRLRLPVACHPQTMVGEYVPFYFCPRSVMLYVISKKNHPNLAFRDGQEPVVHLMADLREAVAWAESADQRWAFSDINAASRAADFFDALDRLADLNWDAISAANWVSCRDKKMAEFIIHRKFPWDLVRGIGVYSEAVGQRAQRAFAEVGHRPPVRVKREWYY
jgi:ssDNA thymidine ADP-ribosyltransferase, DarT